MDEKAANNPGLTGELHDSGERRTFNSGAQRDAAKDKNRPDLISPFALDRVGRIMMLGAKKYSARNWEKGMPLSVFHASAERHRLAEYRGETDEDHAAQWAWNVLAYLHTKECIRLGLLPRELDDMPNYLARERERGAWLSAREVDKLAESLSARELAKLIESLSAPTTPADIKTLRHDDAAAASQTAKSPTENPVWRVGAWFTNKSWPGVWVVTRMPRDGQPGRAYGTWGKKFGVDVLPLAAQMTEAEWVPSENWILQPPPSDILPLFERGDRPAVGDPIGPFLPTLEESRYDIIRHGGRAGLHGRIASVRYNSLDVACACGAKFTLQRNMAGGLPKKDV